MSGLPPIGSRARIAKVFGNDAIPAGAHAGLVFERYLRIWSGDGTSVQKPSSEALRAFINGFNGFAPRRQLMLDQVRRRAGAGIAGAGARPTAGGIVHTTSRLAIGLGMDHPLENGFTFDRVVGVPYLSGASLKGLCRAAAVLSDETTEDDRYQYLGSADPHDRDRRARRQRGAISFMDAYPVKWPQLEMDVMTPHYGRYYKGSASPFDWDMPTPIYFLTVAAGVEFEITLISTGVEKSQTALDWAWKYLRTGLEQLGLGAKTAVGYGFMEMKKQLPSSLPLSRSGAT